MIHGVKRLYISYNSDLLNALVELDAKKLENFSNMDVSQFFLNSQMIGFWALIIYALIVLLIKWKIKQQLTDTVFSFILVFLLFPIGFFNIRFITSLFNSIGGVFTNDIGFSFLISGLTLTLIGLAILSVEIKIGIKTTHNKV